MTAPRATRIRATLAVLAYLAGTFLAAAVTAVALVRLMPHAPEEMARAVLRKGPDKVMSRCLQVFLVLLLPWLLRRLGWRGWHDLGYSAEDRPAARPGLSQLGRGALFGLLTMGAVALAMSAAGARVYVADHGWNLNPLMLVVYAGAALAVGFFEETLARGILYRVPARIWGALPAALVGSVLFGLAHFVETDPAAFERAGFWPAVAAVLKSTRALPAFSVAEGVRLANLALLGGVLCAFVARTGTIWFAIGAHSGWVFTIRLNGLLTTRVPESGGGWWNGLRADGTDSAWTMLIMASMLAAAAWWPRRRARASAAAGTVRRDLPWERWAWALLLAAAFGVPFSIALAQVCGGLGLACAGLAAIRGRLRIAWPLLFWPALAFAAIAVLSVVLGPEPFRLVKKTGRLLWFLLIPVTAALAPTVPRRTALLKAFAAGSGVLGLKIVLLNSWQAWRAQTVVLAGIPDYFGRMVALGSMTAGQMLMIGLLATAALFLWRRRRGGIPAGWWALAAAQAAGLVLNFKRGSWITAVGLGAVSLAARRRWLWLLGLLALVGAALCLHPVRGRVEQLQVEWDTQGGGRLTMWTRIAPALVEQYPLGVGYRSVTAPLLMRIDPGVERKRNHLHSNPVQVLVETGWIGLAVYLAWMGLGLAEAARRLRAAPMDGERRAQAVAFTWMLAGLLLNGLVEYNFGDTELMIVLAIVLGALSADPAEDPA
ncbi:MAG TPA: CPBP family intramembrane metalloprotease [Kiritimatiellia bacterium]|nr:CPBP family intramembrane metalloprotease [Kiritimatiellia bacterium]HRZ11419.1 CPBP family intramembrane metalloprotease [Kiritimatiellia bacterium]HSA17030.1 CPBP family intramembrane metalloprotease [Kiritimatiellia bacterium]